MRPLRWGVLLVTLLASLAAAPLQPEAESATSFVVLSSEPIAPGVTYLRVSGRNPVNDIYVLKVDPREAVTLEVALANGAIPGHESTSSMAARHGALAGINGDFTIPPGLRGAGRPVNPLAVDGRLITSPSIWGRNFALSRDESVAYLGHPRTRMILEEKGSTQKWFLDGWHPRTRVTRGRLAAYTRAGGWSFRPPKRACAVRLRASGSLRWFDQQRKISRRYDVVAGRCARRRLRPRRGIVIATPWRTKLARTFKTSIVKGDVVRVRWGLGWKGVMDTIGGNPTLFEDGVSTIGVCDPTVSYFCKRNPRTGVGWTADGHVLMVVVDGRSVTSKGMTLDEFSALFRYLGAQSALNMDGGGSSTMVVGGQVRNKPSDGGERPVGSSLLVLPGPDPNEPVPNGTLVWPTTTTPRTASATPMDAGQTCAALTDPGSTAGLLDATSRGQLRGPVVDPGLGRELAAQRRRGSC